MKTLGELLGEARWSGEYKYTVANDGPGHARMVNTRRLAKLHNVAAKALGRKERLRVDARGRLGRENPERWRYSKYTGALQRDSGQQIKPVHSKRFDVYVRRKDRPWHHED